MGAWERVLASSFAYTARMRRTVSSFMASLAAHFRHYLINGTSFEKKKQQGC